MKFDTSLVYGTCSSPQGTLCLAATNRGLAGIWFEGQRHAPDRTGWTQLPDIRVHALLQAASEQLQAYFSGKLRQFDLPFDLRGGTDFQQTVWQALQRIPYGETTSYGALSQSIGKPLAVRAVGTAIGRNPISILVPCHRVLGADGSLTGYAGGLDRKMALLTLEGVL
ncbi:MAG: methylated-DNA--[protein]-cysteine S-methyltransferase [Burkholderiaceae bacterium]|nr:methylated-DNA--[protein]-cysteine S-methyltransferase [Burkholderiaceae bacterium]